MRGMGRHDAPGGEKTSLIGSSDGSKTLMTLACGACPILTQSLGMVMSSPFTMMAIAMPPHHWSSALWFHVMSAHARPSLCLRWMVMLYMTP